MSNFDEEKENNDSSGIELTRQVSFNSTSVPYSNKPPVWAWFGLATLILIALLVIFVLPTVVSEYQLPLEPRVDTLQIQPAIPIDSNPEISPFEQAQQARQRKEAQDVLADFVGDAVARARAVERGGGRRAPAQRERAEAERGLVMLALLLRGVGVARVAQAAAQRWPVHFAEVVLGLDRHFNGFVNNFIVQVTFVELSAKFAHGAVDVVWVDFVEKLVGKTRARLAWLQV